MNRRDRIKRDFRNNLEITFIFVFSILITFGSYQKIDLLQEIFFEKNINSILFGFFGSLFGLFLTAYAMFFGIVPQLNKELRASENFKKINTEFFISLFSILAMLLISLYLFFYKSKILFTILIFLFSFDILLFLLIIVLLFLLFRTVY